MTDARCSEGVPRRTPRVAVVAGDGIEPEAISSGLAVMQAATDPSVKLEFEEFPWGPEYYLEHGRTMPGDAVETFSGTCSPR